MSIDGVDGMKVQTELKELQSAEVYFGDINKEVRKEEGGIHHPNSKTEINQKLTTPSLCSPPGLFRRFADCDLTGDCHIHEAPNAGFELPSGSSLPGDNRPVEYSTSFPKSQSSGSRFKDNLFQTLKKVASAGRKKDESSSSLHIEFKPLKDIFHLYGRTQLVGGSSFPDK